MVRIMSVASLEPVTMQWATVQSVDVNSMERLRQVDSMPEESQAAVMKTIQLQTVSKLQLITVK